MTYGNTDRGETVIAVLNEEKGLQWHAECGLVRLLKKIATDFQRFLWGPCTNLRWLNAAVDSHYTISQATLTLAVLFIFIYINILYTRYIQLISLIVFESPSSHFEWWVTNKRTPKRSPKRMHVVFFCVFYFMMCKGTQADLDLSSHWLMLMCESANASTGILKMASVQCWLSVKGLQWIIVHLEIGTLNAFPSTEIKRGKKKTEF